MAQEDDDTDYDVYDDDEYDDMYLTKHKNRAYLQSCWLVFEKITMQGPIHFTLTNERMKSLHFDDKSQENINITHEKSAGLSMS